MTGHIKLKNFVTTFPIKKYFDGHKWQTKDYFYTTDILSKMDWDKPVGRDNISELLWDYMNDDLIEAYIKFTCAMNAIYRSQTGKGIDEQLCDDMGIPTYTLINEDAGILKNNKTGEIRKITKKKLHTKNRNLRILK